MFSPFAAKAAFGASVAAARPGGGGQRACEDANGEVKADIHQLRQQHRYPAAAHDDENAEGEEGVNAFFEIAEEHGTCDHADGADEERKTEVFHDGGYLNAEVPEHERNDKYAGRAQRQPLYGHRAEEISQRDYKENCKQTVHIQAPILLILPLEFLKNAPPGTNAPGGVGFYPLPKTVITCSLCKERTVQLWISGSLQTGLHQSCT